MGANGCWLVGQRADTPDGTGGPGHDHRIEGRSRHVRPPGPSGRVTMEPELVEINVTVPHSPAKLWTIVGNPHLYPRFVRGITFCEPVSEVAGRGARYRYRAGGEGEAEIFVHRRDEHLAWSSVQGKPHRMSVVLR